MLMNFKPLVLLVFDAVPERWQSREPCATIIVFEAEEPSDLVEAAAVESCDVAKNH
jgi:hypothetical protein